MAMRIKSIATTGLVSILLAGQAYAFDINSVTDRASNMASSGGSSNLLSSLSSGSFNFANLENLTGVLNYCQENGYLGSNADIAKSQVMSRLGLESEPEENQSYQEGLSGMLQGDGESFNLSALGDQVGERACGMAADQAMSFAGG
ncbi:MULTISPECIES: DUF2501 domain-containing protein [unclassified Halomonas]|uniref:DUF2501 domain-containing protein n=1 Tax=unclassified Halomonas TaxID=2609666 RepID=UPI003F908533